MGVSVSVTGCFVVVAALGDDVDGGVGLSARGASEVLELAEGAGAEGPVLALPLIPPSAAATVPTTAVSTAISVGPEEEGAAAVDDCGGGDVSAGCGEPAPALDDDGGGAESGERCSGDIWGRSLRDSYSRSHPFLPRDPGLGRLGTAHSPANQRCQHIDVSTSHDVVREMSSDRCQYEPLHKERESRERRVEWVLAQPPLLAPRPRAGPPRDRPLTCNKRCQAIDVCRSHCFEKEKDTLARASRGSNTRANFSQFSSS